MLIKHMVMLLCLVFTICVHMSPFILKFVQRCYVVWIARVHVFSLSRNRNVYLTRINKIHTDNIYNSCGRETSTKTIYSRSHGGNPGTFHNL